MSTLNGSGRGKPFVLTLTPVKYSLTEGTDIPPPPESPVKRPVTPERKIPGAYPSSDVEDEPDNTKPTMDPTSPSSAPYTADSPQTHRQHRGMRKMFSLSSLRQSFSSSRTSLALPRPSTDRPSTSSRYDRPFTPSVMSTTNGSSPEKPRSTRSRRPSWFKRKSSLFSNSIDEDPAADARGNKRLKSSYSVPLLPDISELAGGDLDGGDLGWDASAFKRL